MTCVNDPAVPRYSISGNVDAAVAALPGAKVTLTTEEGVRALTLAGATTFQFDQALFDSRTSLPVFAYSVTATYTGTDGKPNNCNVANGTNAGADGNASAAPAGPVTNVQVSACTFPVSVTAAYSGSPAQAMGGGGVTLELRDPRTGGRAVVRDPASGQEETVPPLHITSFGTASFARQLPSNPAAIYDMVVTAIQRARPRGGQCVPAHQGSAVLLPSRRYGAWVLHSKTCDAAPCHRQVAVAGTYQQSSVTAGIATYHRNS